VCYRGPPTLALWLLNLRYKQLSALLSRFEVFTAVLLRYKSSQMLRCVD